MASSIFTPIQTGAAVPADHARIYAAYGSNHNLEQMRRRCPGARPAGEGFLVDTRLVFAGPLTVEAHEGSKVPVSLWHVTRADIAALDRYEGWPRMYRKAFITTSLGPTFYYVMNDPYEQPPWDSYYEGVAAGFEAWGFDLAPLEDALDRAWAAAEAMEDEDDEYDDEREAV